MTIIMTNKKQTRFRLKITYLLLECWEQMRPEYCFQSLLVFFLRLLCIPFLCLDLLFQWVLEAFHYMATFLLHCRSEWGLVKYWSILGKEEALSWKKKQRKKFILHTRWVKSVYLVGVKFVHVNTNQWTFKYHTFS